LETGENADLEQHLRRYGELPRAQFAGRRGAGELLELIEDSGLRGRGGAGFPTARKMAAVLDAGTARRRPVVVANGCEGDPTSTKDHLLLHTTPHLVLDGLALAAHAVGADQAILCLPRGSALVEPLEDAVARRLDDPAQVHVVTTPRRFVASEASALVNFLTTGDARPTSSPPLPAERGVQGRPTLVDNVETLAHLGLLARHDADWFRAGAPRIRRERCWSPWVGRSVIPGCTRWTWVSAPGSCSSWPAAPPADPAADPAAPAVARSARRPLHPGRCCSAAWVGSGCRFRRAAIWRWPTEGRTHPRRTRRWVWRHWWCCRPRPAGWR